MFAIQRDPNKITGQLPLFFIISSVLFIVRLKTSFCLTKDNSSKVFKMKELLDEMFLYESIAFFFLNTMQKVLERYLL